VPHRICIVAHDDPWAVAHGGTIRTRLFVDACIANHFDTHVVYLAAQGAARPHKEGLCLHQVGTLPLGERPWPAPLASAKRRFLPMPTMRGGALEGMAEHVRKAEPDIVVASQLRGAPYVACAPGARLWLDQADVWSSFLDREILARSGVPRLTARLQQRQVKGLERRWSASAEIITAAGVADAQCLREAYACDVRWLPTAVPSGLVERVPGEVPTAGFFANFAFWPNRDAFLLLRDLWAPALRRLGWRTVVAGIESGRLDARGAVDVLGELESVSDFYRHVDVALAPLRLGGGIKVKVVEALMWRRPVIATSEALEGLPSELARLIPTVDPLEPRFAGALAQLGAADDAFSLALTHFSVARWAETVWTLVSDCLGATTR
jgi:hypothetical protein